MSISGEWGPCCTTGANREAGAGKAHSSRRRSSPWGRHEHTAHHGFGHTPFGKLDHIDLEQLFRDAALPAIETASLEPQDIDGVFVGTFNAGCVPQDFSAALAGIAIPALHFTPAVRMEHLLR